MIDLWQDFHDLALLMYKDIPGRPKIKRREYTISDESDEGSLVEESNWEEAVQPGKVLSLNMILPAPLVIDQGRCPQCKTTTRGHNLPGQRRRW